MSQGYDKFFKEARKASGLGGPESKKSGPTQFSLKAELNPASEARRGSKGKRAPTLTPEERVRAELVQRIRAKKKARARTRQPFPVVPALIVVLGLVGSGVGYLYPSSLDFVLKHVEIGAFGQAQAKEEKPGKPENPAPEAKPAAGEASTGEKPAEADVAAKEDNVPNVRNWSPEELSFFKKLNERKKELDLREAELNKLEEELHNQKTALDEKIKQLEEMRAQISTTLKTRVASDQEKVDKLVQFYSNMKPQQAAKVIETINEDLAIEVLDKMKKKNAAEIMNMMDAKKARRLSELLTGYERSPASTDSPEASAPAAENGATSN